MSKKFTKQILILSMANMLAIAITLLPITSPANATKCDDVKFVFARGSGQSLGAEEFWAFRSSIETELERFGSVLKVSFYELGTTAYGGAQYPAIDVDTFTALGAKISAGKSFAFGESVKAGEAELKAYITEVSSLCHNTKFVLGGYSQGAMVMTDVLPELNADKIIYSATFGDPYLYLPEGEGLSPDACRGKNLSDYREFAPNCYTAAGIVGAKKPYEPINWNGRVGLWCNDKDFMCGAGLEIKGASLEEIINNALAAGHLNYVSDGHFKSAAVVIVQKLRECFSNTNGTTSFTLESGDIAIKSGNRDTVILIDRTASMNTHIERYKDQAFRLAKQTLANGGQVALYTYGDLSDANESIEWWDPSTPKRLTDFGTSLADFVFELNNIEVTGGGDEDESLLSALLTIMNTQQWRAGANKSIIVLTDAGYHDPDLDGTTLAQVVRRSLEIDPVNVYVINTTDTASKYTSLTSLTNGKLFQDIDNASTDYLSERPNINFPLSEYITNIGEEVTFTTTVDDKIVGYDWDLDFDGIFETTTAEPTITTTYGEAVAGYVQVRATNGASQTSTAATLVRVAPEVTPPSLSLNSVDFVDGNARISYDFGTETIANFIVVDGAILGLTTETNLEITGLQSNSTVTLTPIGKTGATGVPVVINMETENTTEGGQDRVDTNPISPLIETQPTPEKILVPNAGKR